MTTITQPADTPEMHQSLGEIVRGRPNPFRDEADQRKLHTAFSEMNALLDEFPSSAWSPLDAQAVLDALSKRYFVHKSQADQVKR